jgi:molybdate transport system substrate-binding protein
MSASVLKLLSSMAGHQVFVELAAEFERASGQSVRVEASGGVNVVKRVQAGEAVDVVLLSHDAIEKLIGEGKLSAGSLVDLTRSGVAVAVRAGRPKPAIDTEAAVKRAVVTAPSVCYSTGPSGVHLEKVFQRWGILDEIRSRLLVAAPGVPVGSLIAKGDAELGFQQLSELMHVAGVEVVGPLPSAIQIITTFSGAVSPRSGNPDAARALLRFMAAPATAAVKQRHGMEAA